MRRRTDLANELADEYEAMARIRAVERAQLTLWTQGLIPGELHTGVGEEAVVVGVVRQLRHGDAMAIDHRSTPPLLARGADPVELMLEAVGSEQGLCGGRGGHMHLLAPELLAASDGIVGSSAATACGFALAGQRLRPGSVAVAFFGEGACNQGVLLESWNLAAAWRLPVVFVCKDNGWAITTRSRAVTGGDLARRAQGFGLATRRVAGWRVDAVAAAARQLVDEARAGRGPGLLLARVQRPDGHFAGDPMLRLLRDPLREGKALAPGLVAAATHAQGAAVVQRAVAAGALTGKLAVVGGEQARRRRDPVRYARRRVPAEVVDAIDAAVAAEVASALARVQDNLRLGVR